MTLVASAEALAEAEWNGLARRGFHLHRWHRIAEACGWVPRHLVVRDVDRGTTVVPAWLARQPALHDLHDRWMGALRPLERVGLELRPVLTVQSPFAQVSDLLGARPNPGGLTDLFERLEETADREGARAVVWPWVDAGEQTLIGCARERGYAVLYAGATAWLPVRWGTFEDYVASRSKAVRRTVRADLTAFRGAGLHAVAAEDFRAAAPAMEALYREAYRRRNEREPRIPAGCFERLAETPTPGLLAQLTWSGERLVGCSIKLHAAGVMDSTFAAFAAGHEGGPAYLGDLVYQPLQLAIERRIRAIDLGSSALYPKVLRGARLRRRMVLVRGSGRLMHRVLRRLGRTMARRQEEKERRMLGALWSPGCYDDGEDDA
ncbi:MAG TPA: peptidogalycan biosysnthesis protein [Gemmatimonadales bacterium]|nr:peptidogalycan biosysnthesis protein [Gemmatimonadales bacterium]